MLAGYQTNMFHHLETIRLASSASSVEFTNLSQYSDYQHLQIRIAAKTNRTSADVDWIDFQVNSDTGSSYSFHIISGTGSGTPYSAGAANTSVMRLARIAGNGTTGVFGAAIVDFLDPFDTDKYLTTRCLAGVSNSSKEINLNSGSWRNVASLTSVMMQPELGTAFLAGSRFSLYGLKVRA